MRANTRYSPLLLLLTLPLLLGCNRQAGFNRRQALTGVNLLQECPWLSETSRHWGQDVDLAAGKVRGYSELGCFALGNGRVFTTEGLRYPFGTMSNIFGPTYQKRQGSLGSQQTVLLTGDKPRYLPRQSMEYVMRSGIVHTRLEDAEGVRMDLYDCVPPDGYAIVRVALVTNDSKRTLRKAELAVTHAGAGLEGKGGQLVSDGPPRWVRVGFVDAKTATGDEPLVMPLPEAAQALNRGVKEVGVHVRRPLGTIKPGQSIAVTAYTIIAPSKEDADKALLDVERAGYRALRATRDWWQKWYSDALTLETPDERINEFIPIQQYLCRIQQAELGGYSPMYMYTTCWVRDSNGPVRFMTQSGKFEEVKRYLDYYYACCAREKRIPMNWPLDIAIHPSPSGGGGEGIDWSKAPTERAEVPSFIILQHYWYWQQSGDLTPIKEHWGYLRRNLLGQHLDKRGRLPFHGDETYRFPGYDVFAATQKEPTDWVSMDLLSADSAWEYVAAASALRTWARLLGRPEEAAECELLGRKVRDALDRDFWMPERRHYAPAISDFSGEQYRYPFANIDLRPAWLKADLEPYGDSALYADPQAAEDSWLNALKWLWKDSGTVKTTPGCGYYVGMTPGYVVWNLAVKRHRSLDQAIRGLLAAASPAAEYSEMNRPDDKPSDKYWGKNRIRPWEGGINAEALVFALTGLRTDPASRTVVLEPWTVPLSVRNIRCGNSVLHVEFIEAGEGSDVKLRVEGEHPLRISIPSAGQRVEVKPGEERTVKAAPRAGTVSTAAPLEPPSKPFEYGEPTFAGRAKTVVVTWSRDTFASCKGRPSPAAIDTKIAFPPEYLAAALYDKAGKRRADTLILDVSKYPGHCKTAEFWVSGQGKTIVDRFRGLGGRVETYPNPQNKPGDIFGE
jgi:hypothetical protein